MTTTGPKTAIKNPFMVWGSGHVARWHTHPDPRLRNSNDLTAAHSWRVAMLVYIMMDDKTEVPVINIMADILNGLLHDVPEVYTGDMSYKFKRQYPKLADGVEQAGKDWAEREGVLFSNSNPLVKLADRIDAWLWAAVHAPDLVTTESWAEMKSRIMEDAHYLGVADVVMELFLGCQNKDWF